MHPSQRNTSNFSFEPIHNTAGGQGGQGHLPPRCQVADDAFDVLLIGSHSTIEKPIIGLRELRSYQPFIHSAFTLPSATVLARIRIVYVYDLEDARRVDQVRHCCEHQRNHGGIHSIYAFLDPSNIDIAEKVKEFGAQVVGMPNLRPESDRGAMRATPRG